MKQGDRVLLFAGLAGIMSALTTDRLVAQTPVVTDTLNWIEVVAGTNAPVSNPNGTLDPGEAVRLSITASFTPPVGSPATYQNPGPGGIGIVAGLRSSSFHVEATQANGGTWSFVFANHGFLVGGLNIPTPNGSLEVCGFGQPYPATGAVPISMNPLPNVWQAVWRPSTYDPRQASFQLVPPQMLPGPGTIPPRLLAIYSTGPTGNPLFGEADGVGIFGGVQIPIVPGSGSVPLLAGGVSMLFCRKRCR